MDLSQPALAGKLGVSSSLIAAWELGKNFVGPKNREEFRRFFGPDQSAYILCEMDEDPRARPSANATESPLGPNEKELRVRMDKGLYAAMERQAKKQLMRENPSAQDLEYLALQACVKYLEMNGQLVQEVEVDKTASARARPRDGSIQRTGAKER